jgi:hypothetical protein
VSLADAIGPSTITIKRAKRLCAPADKNGEDPTAPADAEHLTYYTLKQATPRFAKIRGVAVTNQFGTLMVDVVKPDRMLVPTAKSLTGTPPPLAVPIDHFKCYRVRGKFRAMGLGVTDQFGGITVDLKKPLHLCLAANKNGEGVLDPNTHLLCYQVRITSGTSFHPQPTVFTDNQFGPDTFDLFGPRDLCVASTVVLP